MSLTMNNPAIPQDEVRVSVVIPTYRGADTLPQLVEELSPFCTSGTTPGGLAYRISEIILVHDCGPDRSDLCLEQLAAKYSVVRPLWLSRNFGQHAATLAGMASAAGDWIVTLDEDGQQDPRDIARMLDMAINKSLQLVYAQPTNPPPHGFWRNTASRLVKTISVNVLGLESLGRFNSFRMVDGEVGRALAAYCGHGVYLDVGLSWVASRVGHCPVQVREELGRPSGYSLVKLIAHFWGLVLTTGTRPLRMITITGLLSILMAFGVAAWVLISKLYGDIPVQGWASLVIVVSFFSGAILMSLGVIAEYLAVTMGIAMGRPLYVISSKPSRRGPPA
ncbi:glycosyltransferase [Massilia yuzhufengensis]|uniref:glycosyltransferase n=1 Tax=Massilia yuzhufengensis TaxID=1164594 RepID=UPI001C435B66|nr:glycosyltransferase [Massilia yuzhufengensis]